MTYQRGDVVLVPFPGADLTSTKTRPAVVVSAKEFTNGEGRIIIAGITSNVEAHRNTTRHEIPDWAAAGLKKPSAVTAWLATITPRLVVHRIGELSLTEMTEIDKRLRTALNL